MSIETWRAATPTRFSGESGSVFCDDIGSGPTSPRAINLQRLLPDIQCGADV